MRAVFAFFVCIGLPALTWAQSTSQGTVSPPPSIGLPLPVITAPLAPIGLPLPPISVQPTPPPTANDPSIRPPRDRFPRHRVWPPIVYVVPSYGWGFYPPEPPPVYEPQVREEYVPQAPQREARLTGLLRLALDPATAAMQMYIDGYFVGTPDDLGHELRLETGPHSIEIRAPGFETLVFDVQINADRAITYRNALKPLTTSPKPAASASTTFYYIPGCYMGNVPPEKVTLPANCDLSRLITHKP